MVGAWWAQVIPPHHICAEHWQLVACHLGSRRLVPGALRGLLNKLWHALTCTQESDFDGQTGFVAV